MKLMNNTSPIDREAFLQFVKDLIFPPVAQKMLDRYQIDEDVIYEMFFSNRWKKFEELRCAENDQIFWSVARELMQGEVIHISESNNRIPVLDMDFEKILIAKSAEAVGKRQYNAIVLREGLCGHEKHIFREMSDAMKEDRDSITTSRVREIYMRALRRLRHAHWIQYGQQYSTTSHIVKESRYQIQSAIQNLQNI